MFAPPVFHFLASRNTKSISTAQSEDLASPSVTKYEQASPGSKAIVDSLHHELAKILPSTNRQNSNSLTSFGADGHSKYVFAYLSKTSPTVRVYFFGNVDETPTQSAGMPQIKLRNNMGSDWAKITPYYALLNQTEEVPPLARFLIEYSLPKAVAKRGSKSRDAKGTTLLPEEVPAELFSEGHAAQVTVNRYERDPKARAACLRHHGTKCAGCGIQMEDFYGEIARNYIHVHHLIPLSARKEKYVVNPKLDLIPLCPNCHAVTHLANPPLAIEQLRDRITRR